MTTGSGAPSKIATEVRTLPTISIPLGGPLINRFGGKRSFGVVTAEAVLAKLVSTALVAVTENVYGLSLSNPVMVQLVALPAGVQLFSGEIGTPSIVNAMTL